MTPEEHSSQEGLTRSWKSAQRALLDPAFRTELEASIGRVNESTSSRTISNEEFLALTEPAVE